MRFILLFVLMAFSLDAHALRFESKKLLDAGSMGATVNSNGMDVSGASLFSCQAVWTGGGSPVGTFTVEVSNDDVQKSTSGNDSANVTNWTTYGNSSIAISGDGDLGYNIDGLAYRWARIKYTRTSGTATLNIHCITKSENLK